jgi:hypothetical protein
MSIKLREDLGRSFGGSFLSHHQSPSSGHFTFSNDDPCSTTRHCVSFIALSDMHTGHTSPEKVPSPGIEQNAAPCSIVIFIRVPPSGQPHSCGFSRGMGMHSKHKAPQPLSMIREATTSGRYFINPSNPSAERASHTVYIPARTPYTSDLPYITARSLNHALDQRTNNVSGSRRWSGAQSNIHGVLVGGVRRSII